MIIGSNVSFKKESQLLGCVKEALSYNANTFMFYTGAPQNTNRVEINNNLTQEAFNLMKNINSKNVIVHAPYIINMAKKNDYNVSFLSNELDRVKQLGFDKLVLHPGNYINLSKEEAIQNIIDNLNEIGKKEISILLETMAGKGTEIGSNFKELKKIIDGVNYEVYVCLDTCHINDAGYDLNNFDFVLKEFDEIIGLNKLKCIHINDSKNIRGSKKDRHENIGHGTIGFDNLIKILYHEKLKDIPKILETPFVNKIYPPFKFEIEMILNKKFNKNLIEDIINYYK